MYLGEHASRHDILTRVVTSYISCFSSGFIETPTSPKSHLEHLWNLSPIAIGFSMIGLSFQNWLPICYLSSCPIYLLIIICWCSPAGIPCLFSCPSHVHVYLHTYSHLYYICIYIRVNYWRSVYVLYELIDVNIIFPDLWSRGHRLYHKLENIIYLPMISWCARAKYTCFKVRIRKRYSIIFAPIFPASVSIPTYVRNLVYNWYLEGSIF